MFAVNGIADPSRKRKLFTSMVLTNSKCFKLFGLYSKVSLEDVGTIRRWKEQTRERRGQRILSISPHVFGRVPSKSFLYITGTARPSVWLAGLSSNTTQITMCAHQQLIVYVQQRAGHTAQKKIYTHTHMCVCLYFWYSWDM